MKTIILCFVLIVAVIKQINECHLNCVVTFILRFPAKLFRRQQKTYRVRNKNWLSGMNLPNRCCRSTGTSSHRTLKSLHRSCWTVLWTPTQRFIISPSQLELFNIFFMVYKLCFNLKRHDGSFRRNYGIERLHEECASSLGFASSSFWE